MKFQFGLAILLSSLTNCGTDSTGNRWETPFEYINDDIEIYHGAFQNKGLGNKDNASCYIDFSAGLQTAFQDENNVKIIEQIAQTFTEKVEWYAVADDTMREFKKSSTTALYNYIIDPKSYSGFIAPLERTIKRITERNTDAILITDFEEAILSKNEAEYDESGAPFAKKYFKQWLAKGNSIDIYISKFPVGEDEKKYFILFFNNDHKSSRLIDDFEKIDFDAKGIDFIDHLNFSTDFCKVDNSYKGDQKHSLALNTEDENDFALSDENSNLSFYVKDNKNSEFEYFNFSESLTDLHNTYFSDEINQGRFTCSLIFDFTTSFNYKLRDIDVKVYDVTSNYESFAKNTWAINNKPNLKKDQGNNQIWATEEDHLLQKYEEAFVINTQDFKPEFEFNPRKGVKEISEIFTFDKKIFYDRLKNSPDDVELILRYHKNFNANSLAEYGVDGELLLRVDIVCTSLTSNMTSEKNLKDLTWPMQLSKTNHGKTNYSLSSSIEKALIDANPEGKTLYTFYIKTNTNTK